MPHFTRPDELTIGVNVTHIPIVEGDRLVAKLVILVECAWASLRYNPWAREVYDRICGKLKTRKKKAAIAKKAEPRVTTQRRSSQLPNALAISGSPTGLHNLAQGTTKCRPGYATERNANCPEGAEQTCHSHAFHATNAMS